MNYRQLPTDGDRPSGPYRSPIRQIVLLLFIAIALAGCASVATYQLSNSVSDGIINQDDPELVIAGMPAYLLLMEGTLEQRPEDTELLLVTARLYGAYAALLDDDKARVAAMSDKALHYARKAFCIKLPDLCESGLDFSRFSKLLDALDEDDLPYLYEYAAAWAGSIQVHSDNWTSVADLPRVQAMLERVIAIDERYDHAMGHVYLGVMTSQLPPALGGHPEIGRTHFERAIKLSRGQNLIAYVEYAQHYARLTFDKKLHDSLLNTVLRADTHVNGLTLSNVIARRLAEKLLAGSEEYFGE